MTAMRYIITAIIIPIFQTYSVSQITDPSLKNYGMALNIVKKSILAYGGESVCKETVGFNLYGTNYISGHFDAPEKYIPAPDTEKIVFHKLTDCIQYYGELRYNNRIVQSAIFVRPDSSFTLEFFSSSVDKGTKDDKNGLYLYLPSKFLMFVWDNLKTLSYLSATKEHNIVAWTDDLGKKYNCFINKKTNLIDKINVVVYDDLYGDCLDENIYSNYKKIDNKLYVPQKYSKTEHSLPERTLSYEKFNFTAEMDTNIVKFLNPTWKYSETPKQPKLEIEKITDNLSLIKLLGYNNKVMVAEFSDYIMLFESPKNTGINTEIRQSLQKQFPNKPIRYVALSHHHPDHAGGFSAHVQGNTQIITTKGNVAYFEKLLKSTHTLKPENTISPTKLLVKTIAAKDSLIIKDKDNQVIIYEAGENTDHVQEFLFFYFPIQKILFVGDLVMFPQKGISDQRKRAYSVYKLIEDKKLNVEKIYTSWPLKEQKPYGTMPDLKASLAKNYPDIQDN